MKSDHAENKPFTYLITEKDTGKRYYGVRYAKGCCTSDLGVKYFTSSKVLKPKIKDNPNNYIFEIRRTFQSIEAAVTWEHKVLTRMDLMNDPNWYNRSNSLSFLPEDFSAWFSVHGPYHRTVTPELCKHISDGKRLRYKQFPVTDKTRQNMSKAQTKRYSDGSSPMGGKRHTDEAKCKMRKSRVLFFENGGVSPAKGRLVSDETKHKISVTLTGKVQSKETITKRVTALTGKHRSVECVQRMSDIWTDDKKEKARAKSLAYWNKQRKIKQLEL